MNLIDVVVEVTEDKLTYCLSHPLVFPVKLVIESQVPALSTSIVNVEL